MCDQFSNIILLCPRTISKILLDIVYDGATVVQADMSLVERLHWEKIDTELTKRQALSEVTLVIRMEALDGSLVNTQSIPDFGPAMQTIGARMRGLTEKGLLKFGKSLSHH